MFSHGITFGGHPVMCAIALKNIEIMKRERIVEHVREQRGRVPLDARAAARPADRRRRARHGLLLRDRARQGQGDARDVLATRSARRCCAASSRRRCSSAGLICRADDRGDPVIQISPPLVAGQAEFDEIVGDPRRGAHGRRRAHAPVAAMLRRLGVARAAEAGEVLAALRALPPPERRSRDERVGRPGAAAQDAHLVAEVHLRALRIRERDEARVGLECR